MMPSRFFRYGLALWCFENVFDIAQQCRLAKQHGLLMDLVPHGNWNFVKDSGVNLACVLPDMGVEGPEDKPVMPFVPGFGDPDYAERTYAAIDTALDRAAEAGIKYVLVFTGFDNGDPRDEQFERIVTAYTTPKGSARESLVEKAERLGVTFVIEMLNTTGDEATWKGHPGNLGNSTEELVENVIIPIGSPNFLLAFDVYHVVMMGEDPFELIDDYSDYIGLVHIAGVMGEPSDNHPANRGELTLEGQKVDYASLCELLADRLSKGTYILIEYRPTKTKPVEVEEDVSATIALCESRIEV